MKKVLLLIDTCGPGGAESVFLSIVDHVDKYGFIPVVVLPDRGWLYQKLVTSDIDVRTERSAGSFNTEFIRYLVRLIRTEKIDLIHAHLFGASIYGAIAARLTGAPLICTIHGYVDVSEKTKFFRLKLLIIFLVARYVVFVSKGLAGEVAPIFKIGIDKKKVIYNGVHFDDKVSKCFSDNSDREVVIGCLGNIRHAKDYETMLAVAREIKDRSSKVIFKVYGDKNSDYYQALEEKKTALGLDKVVYFEGFVSDVAAALDAMDLFLLTSKSEGFSLATVEAMSRNLPVIASRSGGPEEIINDGQDGLLVDVGDVNGFADSIMELIENPALRKRLADSAQCSVRERFSMKNMINGYLELYKSM